MSAFTRIEKNVMRNVYVYALWLMIFIHIGVCLILDTIHNHQQNKNDVSVAEYTIMALLLTTEWMLCIVQTRVLISYIFLADIKPIVCLYISKIIACSTIYLLLFKADASQFTYPMNLLQHNSTSYIELTLTFFNYSASAQTCTGVSDTVPVGATAEFISGLQILVFGIAYNVFILSVAILRFSEGSDLEYVKKHDDNDNSQPLLQMESSSYDFFQVNQPSGATFDILNVEQYIVPQKYLK
eukprot:126333_1